MNFDLARLTETQLLEIFNAIIGQPGPLQSADLAEIVELNAEMERRIDIQLFRSGGNA